MTYVARIVRKNGSMVEKDCTTMSEGNQWLAQNSKPDDKGSAVVKK